MSISMNRADGTTVFTLTTDPQSSWPPICQIFKALCYNPLCCKASQNLRRMLPGPTQAALGTLQIIIGLLNIGLGLLHRISGLYLWVVDDTLYPVWLGILFILFGSICVVSQKHPSPCMVILSVILNLAGIAFAVTAVTLNSITVANVYIWNQCTRDDYYYYNRQTTPSPSPQEQRTLEECLMYRAQVVRLVRCIFSVLIILSALQLCVSITASILGIKALKKAGKKDNKETEDPEYYKPLLENATTDS